MSYIYTKLACNVSSYIKIPDQLLESMVTELLNNVICDDGDHYYINPNFGRAFVVDVLLSKFPAQLNKLHQQNNITTINEFLLLHIIQMVFKEPWFITAKLQEKLPKSKTLIEDLILWDDEEPIDQQKYIKSSKVIADEIINRFSIAN